MKDILPNSLKKIESKLALKISEMENVTLRGGGGGNLNGP
jgi:hypothetical protein